MNLPPYPNETPSDWQGMTLQQIQMRRTLVQARMEIQKFKMSAQIDRYRRRSPVFGAPDSLFFGISYCFIVSRGAINRARETKGNF